MRSDADRAALLRDGYAWEDGATDALWIPGRKRRWPPALWRNDIGRRA